MRIRQAEKARANRRGNINGGFSYKRISIERRVVSLALWELEGETWRAGGAEL